MSEKLPWFKFFPFDWETDEDVQLMDFFERGVYLTLLCRTWIEGSIPADPSKAQGLLKQCLSNAYANDEQRLITAYEKIIKLFEPHPENPERLVHWKMEEQRQELISLRDRRRKAGSKGGKQRSSKGQAKLKQSSSEPEPEPEPDKDIIKKKIFKKENNRPETTDELVTYFKSKGMDLATAEVQAEIMQEYFDPEKSGVWRDKNGKRLTTWKRNAANWFLNWQSKQTNGFNRLSADKTSRPKPELIQTTL
tara:strand:+ start:903 stop:1652 length:750 start_codon:yes stop_codon:yes gene_type:complete